MDTPRSIISTFFRNRNLPHLTRQRFYWFFATATMQQPHCLTAISHSFKIYCACRLLARSFWRIICTRRRFLNESEIAVCLIQYLRSSGNRSARLQAVGAAQMRYEIVRWKDGVERLCETVFFDSLGAFLYVDFFHGLNRNYLPRKCENCHRWFTCRRKVFQLLQSPAEKRARKNLPRCWFPQTV